MNYELLIINYSIKLLLIFIYYSIKLLIISQELGDFKNYIQELNK